MKRAFFTVAALVAISSYAMAHDHHEDGEDHDHLPTVEVMIEESDGPNPWNHLEFLNNPENFQFLIVTDRTGGHRAGVFADAVRKINLLQPEFVVSVGDLIEGYTEDLDQLNSEWDEFNGFIDQLEMPFFYVPGNHDYSNEVMAKLWEEKFGRSYYHFVYGDVLFLCLNSEDPPSTNISGEQRAYIKETLEAHPDVRWTFVFLHKPMWTIDQDTGWAEVQEMLGERPHTVFAGHYHNYMKHTFHEENYGYFVLATTGGGSRLRGPEYGEFDHVVWVTMTDDGPRIANLMLDGILDENVRTTETAALLSPFSDGTAISFEPLILDTDSFETATATISLNNPASLPLELTGTWETPEGVSIDAEPITLTLPADARRVLEQTLTANGGVAIDDLGPIVLNWNAVYRPEDRDEPVTIDGTSRLVIDRRYACTKSDRTIVVDGSIDDWDDLSLVCTRPAQTLTVGSENWDGPQDSQFRFDTVHNDEFLYIAIEVTDDRAYSKPKAATWAQDGVLVYLDGRADPDRSEGRGEDDFSEYLMLGASPGEATGETTIFREEDLPEGVEIVSRRTQTGHITEIAIPVALLDGPQDGRWDAFRLNILAIDYDGDNEGTGLYWRPDWRGSSNVTGSGTFFRN